MTDLELAQIKLDVAERNAAEALRVARQAESEWLAAASAGKDISVPRHRYIREEQALEQARDQLEQARAAVRLAEIADAVA